MKMKKMNVVLLLMTTVLSVVATANYDYQVKMANDSTPAYTLEILEDGFAGYATATILDSFCLESSETFVPGHSYYAQVGTAANSGGQDWENGLGSTLVDVTSDPIDERTAFLFTMFYNDEEGYQDETKLQNAIHYIEGERDSIASNNNYVALANAAVAAGGQWYGQGLGNVGVVTLWEDFDGQTYSGYAQDQLVMTAVPEPATIAITGLGLCLIRLSKRKRNV